MSLAKVLIGWVAGWLSFGAAAAPALVPLQKGLIVTSALHMDQGDRENVVRIAQADAVGVSYSWDLVERAKGGATTKANFSRFVRATDMANATRLNTIFRSDDKTQYPGYTAFTFSTAVYDALLAKGETPFITVSFEDGDAGLQSIIASVLPTTMKLKGTLTRRGSTTFPVLLDGRRVQVPALQVHGTFAFKERQMKQDYVLLADRDHPLVLKVLTGTDVFQVIRIDLPASTSAPPLSVVEADLQNDCRAELPGIYFDFAAATLSDQSRDTLASLAQIIGRHPDWRLSIEGHTDDIGGDSDNLKLSQARAQAVATGLTQQYRVDASRLTSKGYGESQPREPNTTLEGRARNRRVEVVRPCDGK